MTEKSNIAQNEEKVIKFWEENKIFEKTLSKEAPKGNYVFYDGPPFATGLPHHGHILSSVIKDLVPRYWTMRGFRVPRRWGWDCHGLPIENLVEKELNISGKKDIEAMGVEKFNDLCQSKVLMFTKEWKSMVTRIGRWVEFDNAYKTMDPTYMESVWWALKSFWDKKSIYEGLKVLPFCPRCETPVSKAEVAMDNSYKTITEESVFIKFKVKNQKDTYILAWTTTPWTLPANVALAVGSKIEYVKIKINNEYLILAKARLNVIEKYADQFEFVEYLTGADLVGLEYEPLYELTAVTKSGKKAWYVTEADFVTIEDGTGVVHIAPVYGEEDNQLGLVKDMPLIPLLDDRGYFNDKAPKLIQGLYFKKSEDAIKKDLEERGILYARQTFTHSYPHCWRCGTQLIYNAISAWFINIQKYKARMLELNEEINWYPEHLKHGRFHNIVETAPDWNISRNRYWATPLPFWKCEDKKCAETLCIGSVAELKKTALNFADVYDTDKVEELNLHKHKVDQIKIKCPKCGKEMSRIPEVIDCWVESGSMPFAAYHYPFENEKEFKDNFPSQYIAEYIAQTRAWFYYMHAVSVGLFDSISFKNCVTTGTILNEKGEKLSKSKKNFTDPWLIIDQYGVDALRFYLMTSAVMQADNLFFNDREVKDIYNKVINTLSNVFSFYQLYAEDYDKKVKVESSANLLDKWILAKLHLLIKNTTEYLDHYDTVKAGREIQEFINELSTWYLRRSRDRFKSDNKTDKKQALAVMHHTLLNLSKVFAPFMPFISEEFYQKLSGPKESVHLDNWPEPVLELINEKLIEQMEMTRKIIEQALAVRAASGFKVRQPLGKLYITKKSLPEELFYLIKDEVNVKEIEVTEKLPVGETFKVGADENYKVCLDITMTEDLKLEGINRELIRQYNAQRKEMGLSIGDIVDATYETKSPVMKAALAKFDTEFKAATLTKSIKEGKGEVELDINGEKIKIEIIK